MSISVENVLSNIAPPSALPTFIINSVSTFPNIIQNQSQEFIKKESINILHDIKNMESTSSYNSDNMPQVLIAPDNVTSDNRALAGSLFTWVKDTVTNSNVLSKVAEKAKNSVNSMITTLDPQMREFICKYSINIFF
jgi:hypothetical protein